MWDLGRTEKLWAGQALDLAGRSDFAKSATCAQLPFVQDAANGSSPPNLLGEGVPNLLEHHVCFGLRAVIL